MAKTITSFAAGNTAASKTKALTPELAQLFVNTVAQTGRTSIGASRCDISHSTARAWIRKGQDPDAEEIYRDLATGVAKAKSDYLLLNARTLNKLAIGGLITLPAFDKTGTPIRNHREGCSAEPGCGCELRMIEKVLMPNPNVLMWQMDRLDPQPRYPEPEPAQSFESTMTDAEQIAEAAKYMDLYREGVQILIDLGCAPRWYKKAIEETRAIETTASPAEAEPEPANVKEPATATDPAKTQPSS